MARDSMHVQVEEMTCPKVEKVSNVLAKTESHGDSYRDEKVVLGAG